MKLLFFYFLLRRNWVRFSKRNYWLRFRLLNNAFLICVIRYFLLLLYRFRFRWLNLLNHFAFLFSRRLFSWRILLRRLLSLLDSVSTLWRHSCLFKNLSKSFQNILRQLVFYVYFKITLWKWPLSSFVLRWLIWLHLLINTTSSSHVYLLIILRKAFCLIVKQISVISSYWFTRQ